MSGIEYKLEKIRLILNNPFNIAHGSSVFRDSIIFTIKYKDYTGYGEAPIVPYYNAEENIITEEIKLSSEKLKSLNFPLEAEYAKSKFIFHSSFAECAFTTALVDILARIRGKRYDEYIGVYTGKNSDKPSLAETSYTISYGSLQDMADAVEKSSYDTIKIKVGFPDDIERLKNIEELKSELKQLKKEYANLIYQSYLEMIHFHSEVFVFLQLFFFFQLNDKLFSIKHLLKLVSPNIQMLH